MKKCSNCGVSLGCSCKERVATDGKKCCTLCVTNYEQSIKNGNSGK